MTVEQQLNGLTGAVGRHIISATIMLSFFNKRNILTQVTKKFRINLNIFILKNEFSEKKHEHASKIYNFDFPR